eukprot:9823322-Karenia_brevis.AAC.1
MWAEGNEDNIAAKMRMEGYSKMHRHTSLNYVRTRCLIDAYAAGKILRNVKVPDALVQGIKMPARLNIDRTHKLPTQRKHAEDVHQGRKD